MDEGNLMLRRIEQSGQGMSSAAARAHIVSTLGLPVPASSPDMVDFPIPARRATSESERSARSRSRLMAAAICSRG